MKRALLLVLLAMSVAIAQARLGETEAEMIARFGKPSARNKHIAIEQGRQYELGPALSFRQDDWHITADLIDGRCVRIGYGKRGEWTEEQIQLVLSYNSQGAKWDETSNRGSKMVRTWRRSDGATAQWIRGGDMKMVAPAYDRAKAVVAAKAKAEASKKPKI